MQNVRPIVENAPDAVTAEVSDNTAALGFGIRLDRRAYVAGRVPGLHRGNAPHQSLVCDADEPLRPAADLTHGVHAARIAIPATDDDSDVAKIGRASGRDTG